MDKPILLIVDDEPGITAYIAAVAETEDFECLVTNSSREFQQLVISKQPSAIIMDIVMPEIDGIELLEWMGIKKLSTPIILMSGYEKYISMTEILGNKLGCNIVGTIKKPLSINDIKSKLSILLLSLDQAKIN